MTPAGLATASLIAGGGDLALGVYLAVITAIVGCFAGAAFGGAVGLLLAGFARHATQRLDTLRRVAAVVLMGVPISFLWATDGARHRPQHARPNSPRDVRLLFRRVGREMAAFAANAVRSAVANSRFCTRQRARFLARNLTFREFPKMCSSQGLRVSWAEKYCVAYCGSVCIYVYYIDRSECVLHLRGNGRKADETVRLPLEVWVVSPQAPISHRLVKLGCCSRIDHGCNSFNANGLR